MINILDYGAVGDGVTMNTQACARAIEAARVNGAAVCVPTGTFLTGTIVLAGVSLFLEAGAVIKASADLADYPVQPYYHSEMGHLRALIVNLGHDNVSVTGSGAQARIKIEFTAYGVKEFALSVVPIVKLED